MRIEEVTHYFESLTAITRDATTHFWTVNRNAHSLTIGDDDVAKESLSAYVYEANRLKEPVAIREVLTDEFAMHFIIQIMEGDQPTLKEVAGAISKSMMEEHYTNVGDLQTVIYGASCSNGLYTGQVVFPGITVDLDRARTLRTSMIEKLEPMPIMTTISRKHADNLTNRVIAEFDQNGVEVPLSATVQNNVVGLPLNPVAVAAIVDVNGGKQVVPQDPPEHRKDWVLLGLKRTQGKGLTNWTPPREYRKGGKMKGTGAGSSPSPQMSKSGKPSSTPGDKGSTYSKGENK